MCIFRTVRMLWLMVHTIKEKSRWIMFKTFMLMLDFAENKDRFIFLIHDWLIVTFIWDQILVLLAKFRLRILTIVNSLRKKIVWVIQTWLCWTWFDLRLYLMKTVQNLHSFKFSKRLMKVFWNWIQNVAITEIWLLNRYPFNAVFFLLFHWLRLGVRRFNGFNVLKKYSFYIRNFLSLILISWKDRVWLFKTLYSE